MHIFSRNNLVLLTLLISQHAIASEGVNEISVLMHKSFDKPNKPLMIEAVAIQDGYAIADWLQGDMGGRALLAKEEKKWKILVCGGSGLMQIPNLVSAQLSEKTAVSLRSQLVAQEKNIPKNKLELINSFKERKH